MVKYIRQPDILQPGKKIDERVDLPILQRLQRVLDIVPPKQKTFIIQMKSKGEGYTTESFGNWFRDRCFEADESGRLHGLRKTGATRLAETGCSEFEIMTFLGHATLQEARKYVKKANRKKMAGNAMAKLK